MSSTTLVRYINFGIDPLAPEKPSAGKRLFLLPNGDLATIDAAGSVNSLATSWGSITGKPTDFPASPHTHTASHITDFAAAVVAAAPPTTNASLLTTGTLPDARLASTIARSVDLATISTRIDYLAANIDPGALDSIAEAAASIGTIQTALAGKADTIHTHPATSITGLSSFIIASAPGLSINTTVRYGDGTSLTFPIDGLVSNDPETVLVALNGVTQTPGTDYVVSEAAGTITFDAAPSAGTQIACTALGLRSVQPPIDPTLYLFAFATSTDGLTTYSGRLLNADRPALPALPETATSWTVRRSTTDAAGRVLTNATATGSWLNRETLAY